MFDVVRMRGLLYRLQRKTFGDRVFREPWQDFAVRAVAAANYPKAAHEALGSHARMKKPQISQKEVRKETEKYIYSNDTSIENLCKKIWSDPLVIPRSS